MPSPITPALQQTPYYGPTAPAALLAPGAPASGGATPATNGAAPSGQGYSLSFFPASMFQYVGQRSQASSASSSAAGNVQIAPVGNVGTTTPKMATPLPLLFKAADGLDAISMVGRQLAPYAGSPSGGKLLADVSGFAALASQFIQQSNRNIIAKSPGDLKLSNAANVASLGGGVLSTFGQLTGNTTLGKIGDVAGTAASTIESIRATNAIGNLTGKAPDAFKNITSSILGAGSIAATLIPGKAGQDIGAGVQLAGGISKLASSAGNFASIAGGIGGIASALGGMVKGAAGKALDWAGSIASAVANPLLGGIALGVKLLGALGIFGKKGKMGDGAQDMYVDMNKDGVIDKVTRDNDNDVKVYAGRANTLALNFDSIAAQGQIRGSFVKDGLAPDQLMVSNNGKYAAYQSKDGNLIVFEAQADGNVKPVWASNTGGVEGGVMKVQEDGNLVLYKPQPGGYAALWNTATGKAGTNEPHFLTMQDDGNLVMYRGNGPADNKGSVWQSNGGGQGELVMPTFDRVHKFNHGGYFDRASQRDELKLIDVNGDGYLDIKFDHDGKSKDHKTYLNNANGAVQFSDGDPRVQQMQAQQAQAQQAIANAPLMEGVAQLRSMVRGPGENAVVTGSSGVRGGTDEKAYRVVDKSRLEAEGVVTVDKGKGELAKIKIDRTASVESGGG